MLEPEPMSVADPWGPGGPSVDNSSAHSPERDYSGIVIFDFDRDPGADLVLAEDEPLRLESPLPPARPLPRLSPSACHSIGAPPHGYGQRARSATPDGRLSVLSSCSTPAPRSDSPRSSCSTPSGSGVRAARALLQNYSSQFEPAIFDTSKDDSASDMLDEAAALSLAAVGPGQLHHPRPPPPRPPGLRTPSFRRSPSPSERPAPSPLENIGDVLTAPPRVPTPDARPPPSGAASNSVLRPPRPLHRRKASSLPELAFGLEGHLVHLDMSVTAASTADADTGMDTTSQSPGSGPPSFDWSREEAEGEEFSENNFISGALLNSSYD